MENERIRGRQPLLHKRTKEQKEHDVWLCMKLFNMGMPYRQIADRMNADIKSRGLDYTITYAQVHYDVKKKLIEWKKETLKDADEYVRLELKKLDTLENEAWNAWEASKKKKSNKSRTSKKPNKVDAELNDPGYYGYTEVSEETTPGNPKFLDLLLNIQQRRARLLGYDSPLQYENVTKPGDNAERPQYNVSLLPEDLLFKMVDALQDAEFKRIQAEKNG